MGSATDKRNFGQPNEIIIRAGHFVFKEGDPSRNIYIIKQGRVAVIKRKGKEFIELAQLGERAVFGEMSLIDDQPRSASIQALEDTILYNIAPSAFSGHLRNLPSWLQAIIQVISRRLRESNEKKEQTSTPNCMDSLKLFLTLKLAQDRGPFNYSGIVKEFSIISRINPEVIHLRLDELVKANIIAINSQQEIKILQAEALLPPGKHGGN